MGDRTIVVIIEAVNAILDVLDARQKLAERNVHLWRSNRLKYFVCFIV